MTCPASAQGPSAAGGGLEESTRRELETWLAGLDAPAAGETAAAGDLRFRAPGTCVADAETLCLAGGRFEVRTSWETPSRESGAGQAFRLTGDTGYFWFFNADNVEAMVKVLDACELDGFNNFWVFAAGLTDVRVTLEVTDTASGERREWVNPQGTAFLPIVETGAFNTCPE